MRARFALLFAAAALASCYGTTSVHLVSGGDRMKYLVEKNPPESWSATIFDDGKWPLLKGLVGVNPDAAGVMPPVLVRRYFDIGPEGSATRTLSLSLKVPGSWMAYVNGAAMALVDPEHATLSIPEGMLKDTDNLLALELHAPAGTAPFEVSPVLEGDVMPPVAGQPRIVKGPYLLGPTVNGMRIEWETSEAAPSEAIVDGKSFDGGAGKHHSAQVTGLQPSTAYMYFVRVGSDKSEEAELTTAPGAGERVRFVVYGDNRTNGDTHRRVVEGIKTEGPDFLLNTGDMVAESTEDEWDTFFDIEHSLIRGVPLYPTIGNHESNSGGRKRFAQLFPLGANGHKVYSADYGDVHIAVLDSNDDLEWQGAWLEKDLTAAEARGATQLFLMMHHGAYSGRHAIAHGSNDEAQEHIVPVARRHRVTAMFGGHDHVYEHGDSNGLNYFVTGGGGAPLHNAGALKSTITARSVNHYLVVDVAGSAVTVEAKDLTGTAFDRVTITR